MSLRFLTRRRDRERSTNPSNSFDTKPSSSRLVLPHETIRKSKPAVPAQVQIISWDPRDLEASGREIHIRSRTDDSLTATPVYHAFTTSSSSAARRGSDLLMPPEVSSSSPSSSGHTPSVQQNTQSSVGRKARPRTAPRTYDQSRSFFDPASSFAAEQARSTWIDTPRSEDVEVLQPTWPSLTPEEQRSSLASKTRRAKSRSIRSQGARYDAYSDTDDLTTTTTTTTTTSHSVTPSSLPLIHRNASVASLASLLSLSGGDSKHAGAAATAEMTRSVSSTSNALLSRIPSTRRLGRSKNASSADIQFSASPSKSAKGVETVVSRSRSSSLSSLTPKFLRQAPTTSSRNKLRGAPPSAWKPDIAADRASSVYSSDNDSSHSHAQESTSTLGQILNKVHVRKKLLSPSHANETLLRSPASCYRPLDPEPSSTSSPLLASSITTVDSPIISGLPLPEIATSSASITSLFTTQLFKRLGPPPVGLPPHCFEQRVELIQSYVLNQLPPIPCPKSPHLQPSRMSLPPERKGRAVAELEDEFDKLECLAEVELLKLLPPDGGGVGGVGLGDLRLEEAFLEARKRSRVDSSRCHFDLSSLTAVGVRSPRMREASTTGGVGSNGVGLGLVPLSNGMEGGLGLGLGVSLKPAPRSRRRPLTATSSVAGLGRGRRPTTAPETPFSQLDTEEKFSGSGERRLFTPQSFSSKPSPCSFPSSFDNARLNSPLPALPPLPPNGSANTPPPSSYNKLGRGSSDRDSSSSHTHKSCSSGGTASSSRSGLFWTTRTGGVRLGVDYTEEAEEGEETEDTASCESYGGKTSVVVGKGF